MSPRYPLQIDGLTRQLSMKVHESGDTIVSESIKTKGIWEAYETQLLLQLLSEGDTFLDIGANIGYYSLIGAECVGESGKVFSFEPEATNFALLCDNVNHFNLKHVQTANIALSNQTGESPLYLSKNNFGDHQIFPDDKSRHSQIITLARADDYLAELPKAHCIKMDVQGSESAVFEGMKALISRSLPELSLIIEFWPHGLTRAGSSAHALLDELIALHLPLYIIDHIQHQLIPCADSDLRPWIDDVNNDPNNEGFMNLLLTHKDLPK
ncbi:MAG: FkbM family methyltransferase [Cellvibrionales bacterium]|nr:FkbM family methyltransferase [Cellvibrionales bacterium]